ncbi:uracil-DNA glycosylase family protein [Pseudoalteromonas sp. PS5]|uniref:uracil-DNA glycosylase family protein n=1 Tax=Pseudoalteromonas sp. PS5 TaxID=1437473 RepID=UPI000FFF157B|nr:uracil-DNA glycosylase family protein [Pseudoalteromonas sp. PS5]RXF04640.1 uracil-DNA glycosylase family protein [Pseudoalteromonas sp. PS5]
MDIFTQVNLCRFCEPELPLGANPIIQGNSLSKILIIGQAPGLKAHNSRLPFNDPSGDRLRSWLAVERAQFYNPDLFAIMPMAFCYPGKGKSGDLAPKAVCAPKWHQQVFASLKQVSLTLLIGQYAQRYYLPQYSSVTDMVKAANYETQNMIPLPHPSPRNQIWLKKHNWFEECVIPQLQVKVRKALDGHEAAIKSGR